MDNGVAQCRLFPELWCVQCAGLCWEFPPLCLSPDYDLQEKDGSLDIWNTAMPIAYFPVELST